MQFHDLARAICHFLKQIPFFFTLLSREIILFQPVLSGLRPDLHLAYTHRVKLNNNRTQYSRQQFFGSITKALSRNYTKRSFQIMFIF